MKNPRQKSFNYEGSGLVIQNRFPILCREKPAIAAPSYSKKAPIFKKLVDSFLLGKVLAIIPSDKVLGFSEVIMREQKRPRRENPLLLLGPVTSLFLLVVVLPGCLATRNWVTEQLDPLGQRVSENETNLSQTTGRVDKLESQISDLDRRVGQVDAKAERALNTFGNLRLQRKLVLSMKEGAQFAFNSAVFTEQTKREIDGFLSDLKNDLKDSDSAVYLVAGHTDNTGSDNYNYELGAKRASSVARYLITQKGLDPTRIVTVSYGESAPLENNSTRQGREKNRRVEILVYKEAIASTPEPTGERTAQVGSQEPRR